MIISPASMIPVQVAQAQVINAQIVSVGDGDTITIRSAGQNIVVRLACIDAPEMNQPGGKESAQGILEADGMKGLAKEKAENARQSKRAYKSLAHIEAANKTVHKQHRKYEGAVAQNELDKKRADVDLANKLHGMYSGYARFGLGIDKTDSDARTRIDDIKAKLTGA